MKAIRLFQFRPFVPVRLIRVCDSRLVDGPLGRQAPTMEIPHTRNGRTRTDEKEPVLEEAFPHSLRVGFDLSRCLLRFVSNQLAVASFTHSPFRRRTTSGGCAEPCRGS